MEFGVCFNVVDIYRESPVKLDEQAAIISDSGFGYVEITAVSCAGLTDDEIADINKVLLKHGLTAKRACILFPGDMKVVGDERNEKTIIEYLEGLMPKLHRFGVEIVVFGSGGARRVPDGFDYDTAFDQFCDTAGIVAEIAGKYDIKIALEHLNPKECNLLTTVDETVKAVRKVNHPGCGLLFDFYHVDLNTDDIDNVLNAKDVLIHSHVAVPGSRLYPSSGDEYILLPYFSVLNEAGYPGTVSIEATLHEDKTFNDNLKDAFAVLNVI